METKFENNRLVVRLQASKLEWAEGLSALLQTKVGPAMFPSIDFSIIQHDEDEEASYVEGDETMPGPVEGALSGSALPEQVPVSADQNVTADL
ncbi:hypothetical protein U1Q18_007300, partial [Sarracenia purpurea var. burkii]